VPGKKSHLSTRHTERQVNKRIALIEPFTDTIEDNIHF
jgi:hypothetical protein